MESGESVEVKQLWKKEFRASAFFLSSVMVLLLQESVGILVALDPLRALIAAQNCLGFLALDMLFTYDFLAFRNLWTTLFLSCLYFNLD